MRYCAVPGCLLHDVSAPSTSSNVRDRCGVCHLRGLPLRFVQSWDAQACERCRRVGLRP